MVVEPLQVSLFSSCKNEENSMWRSLFQVLVQGILLTESNINSVLHTVTEKFNNLLNSLYFYSKGILQKWGTLRRRHRVSPFTWSFFLAGGQR